MNGRGEGDGRSLSGSGAAPRSSAAPLRIAIAGRTGRVGSLLPAEIARQGCVLAVDLRDAGVLIDFTVPAATAAHAARVAEAGCAWVLGTTGLDADGEAAVDRARARVAVVRAANFAPGVALMLELARRLGAGLDARDYDAEILEMHHRGKRDAPSGTALAIGEAVASARGDALDARAVRDRTARGTVRAEGEIGFASLRGGAVVGEHALSFTSAGEQITLSHRAFDRGVFASGAVRAARWVAGRPPGLYGMADVLADA